MTYKETIEYLYATLPMFSRIGDAAIKKYTTLFDKVELKNFTVQQTEIDEAASLLSDELKIAIQTAANNSNRKYWFH